MVICDVTLKVKHLPACLSKEEKEDFLKHFGAIHVKVITSIRKQSSVVYGKFENKHITKAVLHRIHQLKVLDSILCVEYAEKKIADSLAPPSIRNQLTESKESNKKNYNEFIVKINALNSAVGFEQPPLPHLRYVYPKANPGTINNISFALDTVPQFYYQVLHLMNRMNLPPPFSNTTAESGATVRANQKAQMQKADSEESELESDPDDKCDRVNNFVPKKRPMPQSKAIKRPKFIKPNVQVPRINSETKTIEDSGVFEKVEIQQRRSIQLNLSLDEILPTNDYVNNAVTVIEERQEVKSSVINENELKENRLDLKDLNVLPVFKDYHPGVPNNKLYIKNIAKSVETSDLEFIFNRYQDAEGHGVEIKHMKEGRMKGQAFITFASIDMAQQALKETNGFILKDKPLVVVFAKLNANKK